MELGYVGYASLLTAVSVGMGHQHFFSQPPPGFGSLIRRLICSYQVIITVVVVVVCSILAKRIGESIGGVGKEEMLPRRCSLEFFLSWRGWWHRWRRRRTTTTTTGKRVGFIINVVGTHGTHSKTWMMMTIDTLISAFVQHRNRLGFGTIGTQIAQ